MLHLKLIVPGSYRMEPVYKIGFAKNKSSLDSAQLNRFFIIRSNDSLRTEIIISGLRFGFG